MRCEPRRATLPGPSPPSLNAAVSPDQTQMEAALGRLGYDRFRPGQREAIALLFERRRALLVAPTGGGKSLCYQLPALLLPGTTLVVSPLIALMEDQVAGLTRRGIAATYLASTLDAAAMRERIAGLRRGDYRLVYVAPERLAGPEFRLLLASLRCALVAIDEAHCISEWGHDFRPDYLELGALLREIAPAHVLACTATATPIVRDEIVLRLGLPADTPQLVRGFARPNLALRAVETNGGRDRNRHVDQLLAEALDGCSGAAIVYSPTRRLAELETARLAAAGRRSDTYHAGLDAASRAAALRGFTAGSIDVICATNAFGMGIDRADVRAVVHLGPPGSIEAYYQEVGRAGRDGADALGLLCWSQADLPLRRRLLERDGEGATPAAPVVAHKWNLFLELIRWAEGGSCRHDAILRYFGDEAETLAGCGRCDVCLTLDAGKLDGDPGELARILLSGVARINGRFGLKQAVRLLHGTAEERLERLGLTRVSTFGRLGDRPQEWIQRALARCVTAGWVEFSAGEHPVVRLTDEGAAVMRGTRAARWLPPPTSRVAISSPRTARDAERPDGAAPAGEQALFDALRRLRLELAAGQRVPAYVIAHDRTLRELARLRPMTIAALGAVPGLGPGKVERYGAALVRVIAAAR